MRRLLWIACACSAAAPRPLLVTVGEQSGYVRTGRYDEVVRLCHDFARAYPHVACREIGKSGEGRPMLALELRRDPRLPTVMIEAGIHAGEIEGKDAGFWFLRDLLDGKVVPGALDVVDIVFVPVVNPDGHERFGANNRPNQRGPEQMGFRTTGARLNMNRDFVKADTPEIQAVVDEFWRVDPVLLVDLHTTDGAKFEHDISITIAPRAPREDKLDRVAGALADGEVARLTQLGHLPVAFYPSFVDGDDPMSGFAISEAPPRFSQEYAAARDRLGMLVETHSWRTYRERATSTYHALQAIVEIAQRGAAGWRAAEDAVPSIAGARVTMTWDNGPHRSEIAFRGYAYDKRHSEISGGDWIVYDERTPQIWNVPLRDELVPAIAIDAPRGGYLIDGGFAPQIAAVLDRHHIAHVPVEPQPVDVEVWRATKVTYGAPFEGRTRTTIDGGWQHETRTLDAGAMFVPLQQPAARLILHLLEPQLPDSLVQWGELNAAFERKEYMEAYVAEQVARDLIAKDPTLKTQFDAAVAADPELAKSAERRLDWFYRRSAAWDERVNLLPIYRTDRDFRPPSPSR